MIASKLNHRNNVPEIAFAFRRARDNAGNYRLARMLMMAMTTSSSIKVKSAWRFWLFPYLSCNGFTGDSTSDSGFGLKVRGNVAWRFSA